MLTFKPQKVQHLKDALALKTPKIYGDYIVTEKYEGWDTSIYYDGSKWHNPLSSAGREIPAFEWVAAWLNKYSFTSHKGAFVVKAEAYLFDTPFEILNGIFNRSVGAYLCKEVAFMVHDIVFLTKQLTAHERVILKEQMIHSIGTRLFFDVKARYIGEYNKDIWQKLFDEIAEAGGEGIVGKRLASVYQQGKRNADLLKLKLECTRETLAIAVEKGVGKKGNDSYTIVSKRSNGTLIRTVMAKHSDIDKYLKDENYIIGKVIQVKAMQEYDDLQLRQPVFQYVRHDKLPSEID